MNARRLGFLMFAVIAAVLLLHPLFIRTAHSAPVFKAEGADGSHAGLRLLDAPCAEEKVLVHLRLRVQPALLPRFKAAVLTWGGRVWASCWIDVDGVVYSMDEEGSLFQPVPRPLFRDDSV
jgi:hypothetical protein